MAVPGTTSPVIQASKKLIDHPLNKNSAIQLAEFFILQYAKRHPYLLLADKN
jgi:hypothetical protein